MRFASEFVPAGALWSFLRDTGIGTAYSAGMRQRASNRSVIPGRIPIVELPYVIGDAEFEQRFMQSIMTGRYVAPTQCANCGP